MAVFFYAKATAQTPPHPAALNTSAIVETDISNVHTRALVLGNGDLNALLFSSNGDLLLRITKSDVWDARLVTASDPVIPVVNVTNHSRTGSDGAPPSYNNAYPCNTPCATVRMRTSGTGTNARIDLLRAVAQVATSNDTTRIRALAQKNVFLIETGRTTTLETFPQGFLPAPTTGTTSGVSWIHQNLPGDVDYRGMDFYVAFRSLGNLRAVAVVTTRETAAALDSAIQRVNDALNQSSATLIAAHEAVWSQFWSLSGVELGDSDFQNWWYRMLYWFRCFSRPGAYAVGLQAGYDTVMGWHDDYHTNYNHWQPYWTAFNTNHPELSQPTIDLMNEFHPRARWFAANAYGCEGAAVPISVFPFEPDPAVCSSVNKRMCSMMPWGFTIGMGGMSIQNMWNYYLYNPDTSYLSRKIYPVLKDYATFYASFMEKCQVDGTSKTIFGPSYDPEHGSWGIDNSPFDIAYAKYCMTAAVKAATILGRDATLVQRWNTNLAKLPYYPTAVDGASGQTIVQNWRGCTVGTVTSYNIPSPTTPLFPADQVSWFSPASEKSLFQRTITWIGTRVNRNNSNVMLNVARARLSMTSEAISDTKTWFTGKQQPNGLFYWQGHGYFIFEAVAVASLISEFLMQSVNDTIRIFPAWPTATDAKFTDLRAQGGFLISSQQAAGSIPSFRAISTAGGQFSFVSPWTGQVSARFSNGTARILTPNTNGVASLATATGDTIIFTKATGVDAVQKESKTFSLRIIAGKTLFLNVTAVGAHHIAVFGLDGRMLAVFNGRGNRTYRWNPSAPGVYLVRMQTKQGTLSRKVEINL